VTSSWFFLSTPKRSLHVLCISDPSPLKRIAC